MIWEDAMKRVMSGIDNINLVQLKWVAILAPLAILVTFDYVRHFVLWGTFLRSSIGFVLAYITLFVVIFLFAETVFHLIQRTLDGLKRQKEELEMVHSIAESLGLSVNVEQTLRDSLNRVMRLVHADAGVICVLNAATSELVSTAHSGFSPRVLERIRRQKLSEAPIGGQVVATGSPVIIDKVQEYGDPKVVEMARQEGFNSLLSFPLTAQGKVVGVLALASRRDGAFDQSTVRLTTRIWNEFSREKAKRRGEASEGPFTEREVEVLRLVAQGNRNKEIAITLHISENTVNYHMKNIFARLHFKNRVQAIAYARREGIIKDNPS